MFFQRRSLGDRLEQGFRIARWRISPRKNRIQQNRLWTKSVAVEPKPMQVLVALAKRPGETVSREDLRAAVWDGRFTSDQVITVAIRSLRRVLADDVKTPKYIQTLPGKGYKLLIPPEFGPQLPAGKIAAAGLITMGLLSGALAWNAGGQDAASIHRQAMAIAPGLSGEDRAEFLKARYIVYHGKRNSFNHAVPTLERLYADYSDNAAIAITLAEAYFQWFEAGVYKHDLLTRSRALARHALELDPINGETIGLTAALRYAIDWDAAVAEKNFRTAIDLAPAHWPNYRRYALLLSSQSRFDEAEQILESAAVHDSSAIAKPALARLAYIRGDFHEAIRRTETLLEIAPEHAAGHYTLLAKSFAALEDAEQARSYLLKAHAATNYPKIYHTILADVTRKGGLKGYYDYALKIAEWRKREAIPQSPVVMAAYSIGAGKSDLAVDYLNQALADNDPMLLTVAVDPDFRNLRDNAEFNRLLETIRTHRPS